VLADLIELAGLAARWWPGAAPPRQGLALERPGSYQEPRADFAQAAEIARSMLVQALVSTQKR